MNDIRGDGMHHYSRYFAIAWFVTMVGAATSAIGAQVPEPPRPTTDQACLRSDSLIALGAGGHARALLDSALRSSPANGERWFCYGLLNWRLAASGTKGITGRDAQTVGYLRAADSAFRLATQYAPDSAQYWIALGQFSLRAEVASTRAAALRQMENATKAALRTNDSLLLATSSDELGMAIWRRYEQIAKRAQTTDGAHVQLSTTARWRRDRGADYIATFAKLVEPPTGGAEYANAFEHFKTAVAARPTATRFSRHLFMALAEHQRWAELLQLASDRADRFPFDPQARLAIGLAQHRLGRSELAQAAYDSGLALMDDAERARLLRLTRILRPRPTANTRAGIGDSVVFGALTDGQKRAVEAMYWLLNDPLVTTPENEYQLEFLSRVIYAEFSWSDETIDLHGVDTDRGDVFVRFGPPDIVMSVAGASSVQQFVDAGGTMRMSTNETGGTTLIWSYRAGQTFFFDLAPAFGTARIPIADRQFVSNVKDASPVSWTNLGLVTRIDTMDVRITRFRAAADSAEIVVAANIPLDTLLRGAAIANPLVTIDFRVYDGYARVIGAESSPGALNSDSVTRTATRSWVRMIGRGLNMVRVEAMQRDIGRAVRATMSTAPDTARGFALSDILLTVGASPDTPRDASSWRTLGLQPSNGVYRAGSKIGLVWEIYDLSTQQEANRYRVSITVSRAKRSGAAAFALQLLDRVGTVIKRSEPKTDQVTLSFDRTSRSQKTQVEYLSLDGLGETGGEYQLHVAVTDLVAKSTSVRETTFRVR